MARESKRDQLQRVWQEAMREFGDVVGGSYAERMLCLKDRRFAYIAGAQWEGTFAGKFENKPKFEVNKTQAAVDRAINEWRGNRITVDFVPKDGTDADELADTCDMLFRADEQDSSAEEAYDNAFAEMCAGGMGAWRLRACYEDEEDPDNEHQRILFEPIYEADSLVFFDGNAKKADKSDATRCFVLCGMSEDAYRDEFDDDPNGWDRTIDLGQFDWYKSGVVYVAEYYRVEMQRSTIATFASSITGEEKKLIGDEIEEQRADLEAIGFELVSERKIQRRRVHKYIMSGGGVLEDCGYIAGRHIPIIPVYGKRNYIDGQERMSGVVRPARDAQVIANMQRSVLGEISALSPLRKPIMTPEQVAGHEQTWADSNTRNYPYQLINPITDANGQSMASGPVGYTEAPDVPPALAALLQVTESDLSELLGNNSGADQLRSNVSGLAIEQIQARVDMRTFIYMSNMAKAIKRCGEVWLSMAKELYVEQGRKMKGLTADDTVTSVELNRLVMGEGGEAIRQNDLSRANFDISVDVGPSSQSKRNATVRALTSIMGITQDPEAQQVLGAMAMMNLEGEGLGETREYYRRKLIKMGVIKPTDEEAKQLAAEAQAAGPSAQDQYLQAAAQNEMAKAQKAQADTIKSVADADKTRAETVKILTETDATEQKQALEVIDRFGQVSVSAAREQAAQPLIGQ